VRRVVVGGLAVGAKEFPRATGDVDFPVGDEALDVIERVKARLEVDRCRDYLAAHAPSFVAEFDDAVRRARAEGQPQAAR
jgi:hypothetical protein